MCVSISNKTYDKYHNDQASTFKEAGSFKADFGLKALLGSLVLTWGLCGATPCDAWVAYHGGAYYHGGGYYGTHHDYYGGYYGGYHGYVAPGYYGAYGLPYWPAYYGCHWIKECYANGMCVNREIC